MSRVNWCYFPVPGAETYKMAYNASSTVSGLRTVLTRLLELPAQYLGRYDTYPMATDAVAHSTCQFSDNLVLTRLLRRPNYGNGSTIRNAPSSTLFSHGEFMVLANLVWIQPSTPLNTTPTRLNSEVMLAGSRTTSLPHAWD